MQARALARRAAIIDLQRNLLETIQGVIRGVEIVEENWDGDGCVIFGQVRQEQMSVAMSEISRKIKTQKVPNEPKKTGKSFSGLIIDARHLSFEQQKYFQIVDESGKPVYGKEFADIGTQNRIGLCSNFIRIVFEDNESRVGSNPLVIKAQRIASNNTDIVIPNDAALSIRMNRIDARRECKVIVVK